LFEESRLREHAAYAERKPLPNVEETLLDRFNGCFGTVYADTPALIRRAQEIRYQVYCVEHQFENPDDHPDAQEKDKFDAHSAHSLLIHRPTGQTLGTVRLVLPRRDEPQASFAIQQVIGHAALETCHIPMQSTAEVSRFSISKAFRRGKTDALYNTDDIRTAAALNSLGRQAGPLMSLGLIQSLVRMSAQHRITHWCALMEPKLLRMLASMAIHFKPLGGAVEYHGLRQPCYCHVGTVLDRVKCERPTFWQILTDATASWELAQAA
jgi:N-acyl amino acid synthase of PEP-CTERM/exosortase system